MIVYFTKISFPTSKKNTKTYLKKIEGIGHFHDDDMWMSLLLSFPLNGF